MKYDWRVCLGEEMAELRSKGIPILMALLWIPEQIKVHMHVHDVYNHMPEPPHLTHAVTGIPISQQEQEGDSLAASQELQQAIK